MCSARRAKVTRQFCLAPCCFSILWSVTVLGDCLYLCNNFHALACNHRKQQDGINVIRQFILPHVKELLQIQFDAARDCTDLLLQVYKKRRKGKRIVSGECLCCHHQQWWVNSTHLSLMQNFAQCTWQPSTALQTTPALNPSLRARIGTRWTALKEHTLTHLLHNAG